MNAKETIRYICENHCSVSRFGDGEFNIIHNQNGINFQKGSAELQSRLKNVLCENNPKLLLCVPYAINSVRGLNEHARHFYQGWALFNYPRLADLLITHHGADGVYGDTNVTRPYKDWMKTDHAEMLFVQIKMLWKNRDILIVEGSQTRMGIENDLFDEARTVKRILAPAENAFDFYEEILQEIIRAHHGELVLLALGPTATVLASDLSHRGIQALDLGHVDIEYEWYLRKATSKVAIPGKYTNEASDGNCVAACEDPVYLSQIVAKVGIP